MKTKKWENCGLKKARELPRSLRGGCSSFVRVLNKLKNGKKVGKKRDLWANGF